MFLHETSRERHLLIKFMHTFALGPTSYQPDDVVVHMQLREHGRDDRIFFVSERHTPIGLVWLTIKWTPL